MRRILVLYPVLMTNCEDMPFLVLEKAFHCFRKVLALVLHIANCHTTKLVKAKACFWEWAFWKLSFLVASLPTD